MPKPAPGGDVNRLLSQVHGYMHYLDDVDSLVSLLSMISRTNMTLCFSLFD